jgi:hypothetical protein
MYCNFSTNFPWLQTLLRRAPSRARTREIVKARLPELGQGIVGVPKPKSELLGGRFFAWLAAEPARHPLFQDLHDSGRSAFGWLADEQVDVVGHDDVANKCEPVAVAHFAQNLYKQILGARRGKQR